jgi:two-component system sensor histidine kinase MtrB
MRDWDWRGWVERLAKLWRSSLQARTVVTTVVLSGVAVIVIGGFISVSVGNNLFEQRKDQVLATSATAVLTGQSVFNDATEQFTAEDLDVTVRNATIVVSQVSGAELAILPSGGECPIARQQTQQFDEASISQELRTKVEAATEQRLFWQSIEVKGDDARVPGLAVGTALDVVGTPCPLYLVYDLAEAQATLVIVQQTLSLGGIALVLLIGVVTWVVVRLVVGPVQRAAETSERLAAGELDVRLPVEGEDVIATLARSFNGMATSLQSQITRLNALSQVQQRFVSDVSHELRTPLTTIRLAGDVLYDQRGTFPPATARTAELLHTQVERFELLLADLLEMSRFDAGAVDMESEPTNLVRLVEDAIEGVRTLATSKGSDLRLVAPGGYFEAEVDARRIRRILQNLLGNAIDHGEGKPIVVYVDSDQSAVAIAVRDYGVGMSIAAMDRVFDRFWRADPSRQRSTGGTGLGLAIALEDAALHGGWLEVWSAPGEGSCFRLTLPRLRGAELSGSPLELPPPEPVSAVADRQDDDA